MSSGEGNKNTYFQDLRQRVDSMLLVLPQPSTAATTITVHFGPGFLGLGFCVSSHAKYPVAIQDFPLLPDGTPGAAAFYNEATSNPLQKLQPGLLLTHINDMDVQSIAYLETLDRIQSVGRPVKLRFVSSARRTEDTPTTTPSTSTAPTWETSSVAFRAFNAIQYGHFLTLLELQMQIDFRWKYPSDQRNLLHFAARYRELNATEWVLQRKAGQALAKERNIQGRLPMHDAVSGKHFGICERIHAVYPQAIHQGDDKGLCCIHLAAGYGQLELVQWLVRVGVSPSKASDDGKTSVHYAAYQGHLETVVFLIRDCNVDPTAIDSNQCSCLHYAALNGHLELCQWLVFHTLVPLTRANVKMKLPKDLVPPTHESLDQFLQLVSAAPCAPSQLVATSLPDALAIHIQWQMAPLQLDIRWTRVQYFELEYAKGYLGQWEPFPVRLDSSSWQLILPQCEPNTDYSLRIRAVNHNGASAFAKVSVRTLQAPLTSTFHHVTLSEVRHIPASSPTVRHYAVVTGIAYRSKLGTLQEKFALDVDSYCHPKFDLNVPVMDVFSSVEIAIYAVKDLDATLTTSFSVNLTKNIQWIPLHLNGQGEALVILNEIQIQTHYDIYGLQLPQTHLSRYVLAQQYAECTQVYCVERYDALLREMQAQNCFPDATTWLDVTDVSSCVAQLQALSWRGIPSSLRAHFYFVASGAAAIRNQFSATYYSELQAQSASSPDRQLIDADVKRTFSDQQCMDTIQAPLERVLLAFTTHAPSIGYCQSMNYIAVRLLMVLPEEHAFWALVLLCEEKFTKYYVRNLHGVHIDGSVLETLLQSRMPRLNHRCQQLQTPVTILAAQWFLPLFCQSFPATTTYRLLDCILIHDCSVVFALVLAHLRLVSPMLLKTRDYMQFTTQLRQLEGGLYDVDHLLEVAAKEYHSLGSDVHLLRDSKEHQGAEGA